MQVALGPGNVMLYGVAPHPPPQEGHKAPVVAHVCGQWPNDCMDEDATALGTEVDLGPGHIVLDGDSAPFAQGAQQLAPSFRLVYCGRGRPCQLLLSSCPQVS